MTIEPDAFLGEHITHTGTDFIYLIDGEIQVDLMTRGRFDLVPGDSLCHSGMIPHMWTVTSERAARFLCVVIPTAHETIDSHPH